MASSLPSGRRSQVQRRRPPPCPRPGPSRRAQRPAEPGFLLQRFLAIVRDPKISRHPVTRDGNAMGWVRFEEQHGGGIEDAELRWRVAFGFGFPERVEKTLWCEAFPVSPPHPRWSRSHNRRRLGPCGRLRGLVSGNGAGGRATRPGRRRPSGGSARRPPAIGRVSPRETGGSMTPENFAASRGSCFTERLRYSWATKGASQAKAAGSQTVMGPFRKSELSRVLKAPRPGASTSRSGSSGLTSLVDFHVQRPPQESFVAHAVGGQRNITAVMRDPVPSNRGWDQT